MYVYRHSICMQMHVNIDASVSVCVRTHMEHTCMYINVCV